MAIIKNLVGKKFGRLTVVSMANKGCFKRLYNAVADVLCFLLSLMLLTILTPFLFVIYFFRVLRKKKYERNFL